MKAPDLEVLKVKMKMSELAALKVQMTVTELEVLKVLMTVTMKKFLRPHRFREAHIVLLPVVHHRDQLFCHF